MFTKIWKFYSCHIVLTAFLIYRGMVIKIKTMSLKLCTLIFNPTMPLSQQHVNVWIINILGQLNNLEINNSLSAIPITKSSPPNLHPPKKNPKISHAFYKWQCFSVTFTPNNSHPLFPTGITTYPPLLVRNTVTSPSIPNSEPCITNTSHVRRSRNWTVTGDLATLKR